MSLEDELQSFQQNGGTAIIVTVTNNQVRGVLKQIEKFWQGKFPIIMVGDVVTPKYLIETPMGKISQCVVTYVGSPEDFDPKLERHISSVLEIDSARFDTAYMYDATMILAMAKTLSHHFNLTMKQAVSRIASDGHPIQYTDYPNIKALYAKHQRFSYHGYSGRVHFNDKGDNLTAFTRIYPLAKKSKRNHCLHKVQ